MDGVFVREDVTKRLFVRVAASETLAVPLSTVKL